MILVNNFAVQTPSMVSKEGLQRIDIQYVCNEPAHLFLNVYKETELIIDKVKVAFNRGVGMAVCMLPVQKETFDAVWQLIDQDGNSLAETKAPWILPNKRTFYVMVSSHTDIGLHNSQYIQRHNSVRFLDMAKDLCDETETLDENDRYRYIMEGTWFWNNYGMDKGADEVQNVISNYIKKGKIGVCCGVAGNHTQVYGLEELCRSAYEKKRLKDTWDLDSETITMIDNNGLTASMIQPYAEAGIKNIIFAPNQWNPLPSTVWKMDTTKTAPIWNTDAGGGGARIDVRYDSSLPMVFFWEDAKKNRILVWASTQYAHGCSAFGLFPCKKYNSLTVPLMEDSMAKQLPELDEKYPYDIWLTCCYNDDQEPEMELTKSIGAWNAKWQWPKIKTLGNPDEPFRYLREKYDDQIPVLKGDITGGWYQHPVATPELLAQKFAADRLMPTAEKWSTVAGILDKDYTYPAEDFRRAWDYLLYNDEHSYGTSGYQGRRVYETWIQHRDWICKAQETAQTESAGALQAIANQIHAESESLVAFNPTAQHRQEIVTAEDGNSGVFEIPPMGYTVIHKQELQPDKPVTEKLDLPPEIENKFYKVKFQDNGTIGSIWDKEINRELLDTGNAYRANEVLYTQDNHVTFAVPEKASFEIIKDANKTTVIVRTGLKTLGAEILQYITVPEYEKRIYLDNRLFHVKDMVNTNRYYRYMYFAFPFAVENAHRYCHLNGTVAEYAKDVTGHGTDVYMAVNEWCCAENPDFGVALMMLDSQLMEFDHIHPDKTDFGNAGTGSQMFAYVANDWLQMHTPGGSHLDFRFRYAITSYGGGYEKAKVPQIAERYANPIQTVSIPKQSGVLKEKTHSFLKIPSGQRLIGLKRSDDGKGIIARLYGNDSVSIETNLGNKLTARRVRIDESPLEIESACYDAISNFHTFRLGENAISIPERPPVSEMGNDGAPASIGSVYTGLITKPCAAAGENMGHLYLLWGQNMEEDFSHYKLYRSENPGFTPNDSTFVADVQPEEYRVARYEDVGLKEHTRYYYRVCAVNQAGQCGPMSEEFSAFTRERIS